MIRFYKKASLLILTLLFFTAPATAQEIDQERINELVQEEVERFMNSEAFDAAVQRGIKNYVANQRKAKEQARNREEADKVKRLRPVDVNLDHIRGNLDAPLTLVEYSDFECPFCKRFHPIVTKLMEDNPGKVRWVYRHFPLAFHNPGAQKQAEASECVSELAGNDAFWQYTDLIYKRTTSNGNGFPIRKLQPLAEEIGLDGKTFAQCMQSGRMTARVRKDYDNGVAIGVSGTPSSVMLNENGGVRVISGAQPLIELQRIVDELSN